MKDLNKRWKMINYYDIVFEFNNSLNYILPKIKKHFGK